MPASANVSMTRWKAPNCSPVKGSPSSSATAKCVKSPSRSRRGSAVMACASLDCHRGAGPDPVHPGVHLEVHWQRRTQSPQSHGFQERRNAFVAVEARCEAIVHDQSHCFGGRFGQYQHRRSEASFAQLVALLRQGHPQVGRPAGESGSRYLDCAVAVAVRFDYGAHPGSPYKPADVRDVGGDRPEVHFDPGGA